MSQCVCTAYSPVNGNWLWRHEIRRSNKINGKLFSRQNKTIPQCLITDKNILHRNKQKAPKTQNTNVNPCCIWWLIKMIVAKNIASCYSRVNAILIFTRKTTEYKAKHAWIWIVLWQVAPGSCYASPFGRKVWKSLLFSEALRRKALEAEVSARCQGRLSLLILFKILILMT